MGNESYDNISSEILEMFFLDEYTKRHAMLDEDMFSEAKKYFEYAGLGGENVRFSYSDLTKRYNQFEKKIVNKKKEIYLSNLIKENEIKYYEFYNFDVKNIITLLQYHSYYVNVLSKENKEIINMRKGLNRFTLLSRYDEFSEICERIMDSDISNDIMLFFLISLKYDLFIGELINKVDIDINLKNNFNDYSKFINISFLPLNRDFNKNKPIDREVANKKQFKKLLNVKKDEDVFKIFNDNFLRKVKKTIFHGNHFRKDSTSRRLIGLWLWDECGPLSSKKYKTLSEAIKEAMSKSGEFDDDKIGYLYFSNTKKCIEERRIVPIG